MGFIKILPLFCVGIITFWKYDGIFDFVEKNRHHTCKKEMNGVENFCAWFIYIFRDFIDFDRVFEKKPPSGAKEANSLLAFVDYAAAALGVAFYFFAVNVVFGFGILFNVAAVHIVTR